MKEYKGERVTENITLCEDGKYRWRYDLSLYKNPEVFFLVWKIFFFIIIGIFAFLVLLQSGNSRFWWDGFLETAKVFGFILIGMTVVTALGYLLYAAVMGGKYCVEFEMDENGIKHKQITEQSRKAKNLAKTTAFAGAATRRLTNVGVGINAARTEMYSDFASVKRVKVYPLRNLIKVNGRLSHNQIYAANEDFEFVKNYILKHCEKNNF